MYCTDSVHVVVIDSETGYFTQQGRVSFGIKSVYALGKREYDSRDRCAPIGHNAALFLKEPEVMSVAGH